MSRIRDIANVLSANTDMATDAEVTSSIASHAAAADPHTVYLKESEFGAAGKNYIINGGMDIWQRGTSVSATNGNAYTADRWYLAGNSGTVTVSRQSTSDTTNIPNIQYCARVQRNSGSTSTGGFALQQSMETVNSISLTGKAVTFSFYARSGTNYSATSSTLGIGVYFGTGTDQNFQSGYTGSGNVYDGSITLTTTWQRFIVTGTVSTSSNELAIRFNASPTGTAGVNDYFEVTGVQLELGSAATPFSRAGGDIQGEFAKCQRYYQVLGDNIYEIIYGGYMTSGTVGYISFPFPVTMRGTPAATIVGNWAVFNTGQPTIQSTWPHSVSLRATSNATGQFYFHSNTTYYITISAEL